MPGFTIRYVATVNGTSTYKVEDQKGVESTVIVVLKHGTEPMVHCLTCSAYKCEHARAVLDVDAVRRQL